MSVVDGPTSEAEQASYLPHRLAELVNIVFAVVMAESLARYNGEIVALSPALTLFALLVVYVITISSWWGYHRSLMDFPYLNNHLGFLRFALDLFTVVIYAYLIYAVRNIDRTDDLSRFIWGVPAVFGMYLSSGIIRRVEYAKAEASRLGLLVYFTFASLVFAALYDVLDDNVAKAGWSWCFLALILALVLAFRLWRLIYYAPILKNWR